MERRWNQEKSLRETAEIKLKALKKQFRALKDDIQNVDFDTAKEDESVGTHQTGGMHSRTNSLDGTLEFLGNAGTGNGSMLLTVQETSKHTVTPPHPNSVNPATISTIDQTGRTPRDFSNKSPLRETATKSLQGLQQSPTAPIGYKIGETVGSSSPGPRSNTNEVGETNGSSKGNHPRQQQQQQQQSLGNLSNTHISGHANSTLQGDFIENSAQPVASTANLGAPPRPAANKTRHVGSGSFEPSWSDTFDFDPLRPVHQKSQGVDDGLVTTEPEQMQSKSTSTSTPPVCKINHNHMLTPSGLASEAAEDSDLMSFQPPMMVQLNLAHTDAYMSMSHNQQQSATKHQRTHSGRPVIPSQVTMKPYHDQPTMLAALAQGNQPQILMPMQQSVVQVPSQQYQQQQQQQQQQWATQQQYSNSTISQPDLLSGRQQTQNTGQTRSDPMTSLLQPKFESSSDPFDELVQKLRPSTNA